MTRKYIIWAICVLIALLATYPVIGPVQAAQSIQGNCASIPAVPTATSPGTAAGAAGTTTTTTSQATKTSGDLPAAAPTNPPSATPAGTTAAASEAASTVLATEAATASASAALDLSTPEMAVTAYFDTFKAKNWDLLSSLISDYSLTYLGVARSDIRIAYENLDFRGLALLDFRVLDTKMLSDSVAVADVAVKTQTGTAQPAYSNETPALHLENGQWKINTNRLDDTNAILIDYEPLSLAPQTVNNVTIRPLNMARYSNQLRFTFCLDNTKGRAIIWAAGVQVAANFKFGSSIQNTFSRGQGSIFNGGQSYTGVSVAVANFQDTYPDEIDLTNWQYASDNLTTPTGPKWQYKFTIKAGQ